jgi:formylglycine-generating enzyme required for sulfatase activity
LILHTTPIDILFYIETNKAPTRGTAMKYMKILIGVVIISVILLCGKENGLDSPLDPNGNNWKPPAITALTAATDTVNINDSIAITAAAIDNGTVIKYAWAKNGASYADTTTSGSWKTAFADSGRNVLHVKARDNDGVWSAPDSCMIMTTTDHPVVKAMAGSSVNINDSILITATAIDNGTVIKYVWTKTGAVSSDTTTEGSLKTAFATSGRNVIRVMAIDDDGLWSLPDSCVLNVTLDAPIPMGAHDTTVSRTMSVTVRVSARDTNRTGSVQKYYWDIGASGWDDSTTVPQKTFSNPSGGPLAVIWAARDDDGVFSKQDMFTIHFNNPPIGLNVMPPLGQRIWAQFNFTTGKGTIPLAFSAIDTDGVWDTLTYTLFLGVSPGSLVQVYSGKANRHDALNLDSSAVVYWRLKASDLYGDSTVANDSFITPPPSPPGMIFITGGTFQMGQTEVEEPVHNVTVSSFWMDTTEVTQADYRKFMGVNPAQHKGDSTLPVEKVSWFDAAGYCNARSKRDGLDTVYNLSIGEADLSKNGYRLPTEAQWEYACRAGSTTQFYFDSAAITDYTWSQLNSSETKPVAKKIKNAFGLFDMCGNVIEWCNDRYGNYDSVSVTDPAGPAEGSERVCRGGSYTSIPPDLRSARRSSFGPAITYSALGFRVVFRAR